MPIINCYVDDTTLAILTEYGQRRGRTVEDLAECAIAEAALHAIPPQARVNKDWIPPARNINQPQQG